MPTRPGLEARTAAGRARPKRAPLSVAAASLLLVAACETTEVVELRAALAEREKDLARMRGFADEYMIARRDKELLVRSLPKAAAGGSVAKEGPTPAKLLEALRQWSEAAGYSVGRFEVGLDGSSKARLDPIRLPEPAPAQAAARPPPPPRRPLPEPSVFSGGEGRKLRRQIAEADVDLERMRVVLAELDKLSAEFATLRVQLRAVEALKWGRLGTEPGFLDKVFGEPRPLLREGKAEAAPGGFEVAGRLSPGAALEDLRAAVPSGYRVETLAEEKGTVTLLASTGAR